MKTIIAAVAITIISFTTQAQSVSVEDLTIFNGKFKLVLAQAGRCFEEFRLKAGISFSNPAITLFTANHLGIEVQEFFPASGKTYTDGPARIDGDYDKSKLQISASTYYRNEAKRFLGLFGKRAWRLATIESFQLTDNQQTLIYKGKFGLSKELDYECEYTRI
jgi:hypothetical protein